MSQVQGTLNKYTHGDKIEINISTVLGESLSVSQWEMDSESTGYNAALFLAL